MALSSGFHFFCQELSCQFNCYCFEDVLSFLHPLASFTTMMHLGVKIPSGKNKKIFWVSGICGLVSFFFFFWKMLCYILSLQILPLPSLCLLLGFQSQIGKNYPPCLSCLLLLHSIFHPFICYTFWVISLSLFFFLAVLGLRCCARAFSSCGERGLLFVEVCGLLIVVASLVAEHGL